MDKKSRHTVLCVTNEARTGSTLTDLLASLDHEEILAQTGTEALTALSTHTVAVVVLNLHLPDWNGQELVRTILTQHKIPVIVLTDNPDLSEASAALTAGATAYLSTSSSHMILRRAIAKALVNSTEIDVAKAQTRAALLEATGLGSAIRNITLEIDFVAETDLIVLLEGETGTGKELFARAIHDLSPRKNRPFVVVDCSTIPPTLFESEVFGHQKGAFTGADQTTQGLLGIANSGSVFFDEIDSLPLPIQSKLLRVIEAREYRPVGSSRLHPLDIRIIAGSGVRLEQLIQTQQFRADLYYRLAECVLRIPPLRERQDDLYTLVKHIKSMQGPAMDPSMPIITPDALALLKRYHWPGNVRELRNTLRRCQILADGQCTTCTHILISQALPMPDRGRTDDTPARPATTPQDGAAPNFCDDACPLRGKNPLPGKSQTISLTSITAQFSSYLTRWILAVVLQQEGGNKAAAARRLGIDYKTLRNKLQALKDRT